MSVKISDLIAQYDQVMVEREARRKYGIDPALLPSFAILNAVDRLHPKKLRLRVASITPVTDTMKTFRFVLADEKDYLPPFIAGQYLSVSADIDGVHASRPISISSSPTERAYYEITVKRKADGFLSDYLHDRVKVGDIIETSGPAGHFYYHPAIHGDNYVFIAGGNGITPFLSMIREITDAGLPYNVRLLYGCRNLADVPYLDELKARSEEFPNFKFDLILSDPDDSWTGLRGFIGADLIRQLGIDTENNTFFVAGPTAMYDFCIPELKKLGIPGRKIRKEIFGAPADITKDIAWPENVSRDDVFTMRYNGQEFPAKASETILTAFERAGIHHRSQCRAGECSLCRVKLVSGDVFQSSVALVRESDERLGYVHSCVSYPISDIEVR